MIVVTLGSQNSIILMSWTYIVPFLKIVLQVQSSPFSSCHSLPPHPSPPPTLNPTPLRLCPWIPYICSFCPFPFFPPLSLSPILSGYCHFVLYFNVSGCIYLFIFLFSLLIFLLASLFC